jgi:uncharacterized RDD family membrane protein YckC
MTNGVTHHYIQEVLKNVQAPSPERARIEADLRAHLQDVVNDLGPEKTLEAVVARMGRPDKVAEALMSNITLHYASFWHRLLAFIIDAVIMAVAIVLVAAVSIAVSNQIPPQPQGLEYVLVLVVLTLWAVCLGIFLLYFPILEARSGRTIAKRLLGLRVVKTTGAVIGFKEALVRRLSFYFEILPIDAAWIFFNPKRQRLTDILAGTVVIQEPA